MSDLNQILDSLLNLNDYQQELPVTDASPSIETPLDRDSDDSDYEDIDENNPIESLQAISINVSKDNLIKKAAENDDEEKTLRRILRPRRHKRQDNDEEDTEENQYVPEKPKTDIDEDENDRLNPAYVPRKGKFFEHDDRTSSDIKPLKREASKTTKRFYRDSDGKWQHDLYFRDQQTSKSKNSNPKRDSDRLTRANSAHRDPGNFQETRPIRTRSGTRFESRPHLSHDLNQPWRSIIPRSFHNHRTGKELNDQMSNRRQKHSNYRQFSTTDRERQEEFSQRNDQQRSHRIPFENPIRTYQHEPKRITNRLVEPKANNEHHRHVQHSTQGDFQVANHSRRVQTNSLENFEPRSSHFNKNNNTDQSKRYSNIRLSLTNSSAQRISTATNQVSQLQQSNDWPQVPSLPESFFSHEHLFGSRQQRTDNNGRRSPQVSRFVPLQYPQTSRNQRLPEHP